MSLNISEICGDFLVVDLPRRFIHAVQRAELLNGAVCDSCKTIRHVITFFDIAHLRVHPFAHLGLNVTTVYYTLHSVPLK